MTSTPRPRLFLCGVFLITFAVLVFQVVQTRILSVIAWYYLAFFAISVAMLGMTAGAVWVYVKRRHLKPGELSTLLSDTSLLTAVAMPASVLMQFCLIITLVPTATSVAAWAMLMGAMTVPYVFAGITVSLALTRSPFPVSLVYGVDLLGAAFACAAVVGILDLLDGPSAIMLAGLVAGGAALAFARGATPDERRALAGRARWRRPAFAIVTLGVLIGLNQSIPVGFKPVMVKDAFESTWRTRTERWNSYSRVIAYPPETLPPQLWGPSPNTPWEVRASQVHLNIDGSASTSMLRFDGTRESVDFLRYDIVNLAYHLPRLATAAVIGVGGGRDLISAHVFGVEKITGVELNRTFIDLLTKHAFFAPYANLAGIPGLALHVDDARTWFAATDQSFDLIQMSMIDTWASTGAGAFSLSENGLYTLEGWRAFTRRLTDAGVFTVSRWYNPSDVNESGRMISLALATMFDGGAANPRRHVFVARGPTIATLVLSRSAFTPEQLQVLREATLKLGFAVLIDPDTEPESEVLRAMVHADGLTSLDRIGAAADLDLTIPTDNRPFFFNQLRFRSVPGAALQLARRELAVGVARGNLTASIALVLILAIAVAAVVCTIVLPLRAAIASAPRRLIAWGSVYFAIIGLGFMFAEISLLQFFGVFLGHPIYAMGVCLFSLILSSGLGSLASERIGLTTDRRVVVWGVLVGGYLLVAQALLTDLFAATTAQPLPMRIAISLAVVMPVGFLMGFAFPTGMKLVERVDREPTPWFWGINGATGVLASVVAVMLGITLGINVTMMLAGVCYLALIPAALALSRLPAATGR